MQFGRYRDLLIACRRFARPVSLGRLEGVRALLRRFYLWLVPPRAPGAAPRPKKPINWGRLRGIPRIVRDIGRQVFLPWILPKSYPPTEHMTDADLAEEARSDVQILRPIGLFNSAAYHFVSMNRQYLRYMHRIGELGVRPYIVYYVFLCLVPIVLMAVAYMTVESGRQDPTSGLAETPWWVMPLIMSPFGFLIGPLGGRAAAATMQWSRVYARCILVQHTWVRCGLCAGEKTLMGIEIGDDSENCAACAGQGTVVRPGQVVYMSVPMDDDDDEDDYEDEEDEEDDLVKLSEEECQQCYGVGRIPQRRTCPACIGVGRVPDQPVLGAATVASRLAILTNSGIEPTAGGDLVLQCPDGFSLYDLHTPCEIYDWQSIHGEFVGDYAKEMHLREVAFDAIGRLAPKARTKDRRRQMEQAVGYGIGVIFAILGLVLYGMQQQPGSESALAWFRWLA